jgi:hypothetical protein
MGSLGRRLCRLEGLSREDAVAELRRAWANLTDEEIGLILAPCIGAEKLPDGRVRRLRERTPEEREVEEKARATMPEELISRAIGRTERMADEEVDRRIRSLNRELGIFERGDNIRRHMLASGARGEG